MLQPAPVPRTLPLGLLEFLDFRGLPAAETRERGLAAAVLADQLGYHRLWVPEHHARGVAVTNPLLLLPVLGTTTQTIRLGTAVVLLRLRDPYLLAEDLTTAAHFCSGRLDVGLGRGDVRGPGTHVLDSLRKDEDALDQATRVLFELLDHGNAWIDPPPGGHQRWLHGAGSRSAELAGGSRSSYCHALFFNPDLGACLDALAAHRAAAPAATRAVALAVVCNRDRDRALADADLQGIQVGCVGSPEDCVAHLLTLLAHDEVDEVVLTEQSARAGDHEDALRSIAALFETAWPDGSRAPAGLVRTAAGV